MSPTGLYPNGFYQTFWQMNFDPALDQMLFAYCHMAIMHWEDKVAIKETYRLCTLRAGIYTSLKSIIVMTHDQSNN